MNNNLVELIKEQICLSVNENLKLYFKENNFIVYERINMQQIGFIAVFKSKILDLVRLRNFLEKYTKFVLHKTKGIYKEVLPIIITQTVSENIQEAINIYNTLFENRPNIIIIRI